MPKKNPPVSKRKDTQCLAFGSVNIRQCRLEQLPGEKTCQMHRNYYKNWLLKRYPPYISVSRLTDRQIEEFRFQIEGNHVEITDEYLKKIPALSHDCYIFLMNLSKKSPSLNPEALKSYVNVIIRPFYHYPISISSFKLKANIKECMTCVLKDVESCTIVYDCVLHFIFTYVFMSEINRVLEDDLEWILENIFIQNSGWSHLLYSTILLENYNKTSEEYIKKSSDPLNTKYIIKLIIAPIVSTLFDIFTIVHKETFDTKMKPLKEELLEKAWHPRRQEYYLSLGYTIEEVFSDVIH
jgi:hypothetical protein